MLHKGLAVSGAPNTANPVINASDLIHAGRLRP